MAGYLATPRLSNDGIMQDDAAMRLKFRPRVEAENKILMPQANQLNQIAVLGVRAVRIPAQMTS